MIIVNLHLLIRTLLNNRKIYKIFECVTNVTLPTFIEDYINNKLSEVNMIISNKIRMN